MIKSGLCWNANCNGGIGFWGPNGHDAIWHLSLSASLARGSLDMPVFAGEVLKNYHIGFDLFLALFHKLTTIPLTLIYFQILPPILALSVGLLTYIFVMRWRNSISQALWAVFFVYFSGSFGWLITLLRGEPLGGESMFWSQQSVSTLLNPPYALSVVLILLGLLLLIKLQKNSSMLIAICCAVIFGLLIEIKAYAGILALASLFALGVVEFIRHRKTIYLSIFTIASIISLLLFLPLNSRSSGLLVFQPFWFLETMMGLSDRLNWPKYYQAMITYRSGVSWKMPIAYLVAFFVFWFGNLGTRAIKEVLVIKWLKKPKLIGSIELFFASAIVSAVVIPMVFLQKGTPWNTIQFLYYSLFFSSILAGCTLGEFLDKRSKMAKLVLAALVVLLTIPTTVSTLWYHYIPSRPPAKLSAKELEGLTFLSKQPTGVVLTYPFDSQKAADAVANPPRSLYLYDSTAYVSAFANKPVFLEDQVNLDITGYNWPQRRKEIEGFYRSTDHQLVWDFLRNNSITYVYWLKGQRATLGESQLGIEKIFENEEVDIYQVIR